MVTFSGLDHLSFQASNGITESRPAEVSILVGPWSGDTTPPEVSWRQPAQGDTIAEVSAAPVYTDSVGSAYAPSILVQFSEAISVATVTTATVQMASGGAQPVSSTVAYDAMSNWAIIVPREPLQDNTLYTVAVSQGVKDLMGNPLAADYTWSFQIGSPSHETYLPLVLRRY